VDEQHQAAETIPFGLDELMVGGAAPKLAGSLCSRISTSSAPRKFMPSLTSFS
jgi:hypothetical protein